MTVRVRLIRPDDLVNLLVEGGNMRLDTIDPASPVLVVDDPGAEATLTIGFPPQTVVEEAVFDQPPSPVVAPAPPGFARPESTAPSKVAPDGVLASRLSGDSRLVFTVPPDARIPYTFEGLLDWAGLEPRLSPLASVPLRPTPQQARDAGVIKAPEPGHTALELPYRLILSPTSRGRWVHRREPVTRAGRTELWHTRLGRAERTGEDLDGDGEPDAQRIVPASREHPEPLRAIWSPDYENPPAMGDPDPDWPVLTAMTPRDRHEIVALTSGFTGFLKGYHPYPTIDRTDYEPQPVAAERLMLSALGGYLTSRGSWDPPMPWVSRRPGGVHLDVVVPGPSLNVSEWVHHATQGRDHYVRIVYEGVVAPFGHRASLIKVTERKIRNRPSDGSPVAFLAQRMFVVIRQPVMDYRAERAADPAFGRRMPFRTVRLTTLITPDIMPPVKIPRAGDGHPTDAFWIEVATGRFRFNAVAEGITGKPVDFSTTLVFIPFSSLSDPAALHGVRAAQLASGGDRACPVPGQQVTYADPLPASETDNTTQVTEELHFTSEVLGSAPSPRFRPTLLTSFVRIPAVEQLLGTTARTQIVLRKEFVAQGFDSTASGLFALVAKETTPGSFTPTTLGASFSADQGGGVATPNLSVSALTRQQGPVAGADMDQLAEGAFDPADFFAGVAASARLFGTFALSDLVEPGRLADGAPKVQLTTDLADPAQPKQVATLTFTPTVRALTVGIASFEPSGATTLTVTGRVERVMQPSGGPPSAPTSEFAGALTDFGVSLANVVIVNFQTFSFRSASGAKPSVDITLKPEPVSFAGDLAFVDELKKVIPPGLFGDGASLDVTPNGIRAGFAIGLPPLAIGVFSLEGISLSAAVELPFADGKPLFDFAISSREHPFCLTVACLGGGGFFHLQVD
ncbi:MAG: hypothetical protein WAR57_10230, partial [Candidatus Phosphoribacter sp.]